MSTDETLTGLDKQVSPLREYYVINFKLRMTEIILTNDNMAFRRAVGLMQPHIRFNNNNNNQRLFPLGGVGYVLIF